MGILKISLGFIALFLAWGLLFRTGLIFRLNTWLKENIFNDQFVLYSRRRLALLLFILGLIALFSGVESVFRDANISPEGSANLLREARADFKSQKYSRVAILCRSLLKAEPRNIAAREILCNALWALGQREEAFREAKILNYFDPSNSVANLMIAKEIESKSRAK